MKFIFEAIHSMFARLTALISFLKTGRSGHSSVKFGAPLVAFGLLLGLILIGCDPASSSGASGNGPTMPPGMTIDETVDCAVGTATACTFAVGDIFTGEVGGTDDPIDWVKVTLALDTSYRITATPDTAGTTAELHIHTDGSTPETAADPDIGDDNLYTATTAAVHYIEVGLSVAGGYELTIALAPEGEEACNSMDAEADCDGDNVSNDADAFPLNACATMDSDDDGHPDTINAVGTPAACTTAIRTALLSEMVGGISLQMDNCPTTANPNQLNSDSGHTTNNDALGDVCDPDKDGDNVLDNDAPGIVDGTTQFNSMTVTATTPRDEFPLDAARSCTITTGTTGNRTSTTLDCDNDGAPNSHATPAMADVDDDGDGLIELSTETELNNIRNDLDGSHYSDGSSASNMGCPSGGCSGYELVNDIALSTHANWEIVDSGSNPFDVIFEGNGYAIRGLAISSSSGTAIGFLDRTGLVRNLHIAGGITHSTTVATIGGLAATNTNIYNSSAAVTITTSVVSNNSFVGIGGLTGDLSDKVMKNSWASGTVTANTTGGSGTTGYSLGGLIGSDNNGLGAIANVYATGEVRGDTRSNTLGGLTGQFLSSLQQLTNSYASGAVTGGTAADTIGGLVGSVVSGTDLDATRDSYYSGTVTTGGGSETASAFTGISAQELAVLQGCGTAGARLSDAASTLVCTGIYTGWAATDWDFGTASQLPALKFAEHSEGQLPDTPDCTPVPAGGKVTATALRPSATAQPYCGELLPMQPGR